MKLSMIVAIGTDSCIGKNGAIPWQCKMDMKHFRETTMGKHVIMGRKTWESLPPKKLPGRKCFVLSSTPIDHPDVIVVESLEQAMAMCSCAKVPELVIIGGQRLFEEYYSQCDVLHITTIFEEIQGADTFFRFELAPDKWRLIHTAVHSDCCIHRWVRR